MKKYKKLISIAFITAAMAACSPTATEEDNSVQPSSEPDPIMIQSDKESDEFDDYYVAEDEIEVDEDGEVIVPVSEPIFIDYGDSGYEFSLSEDEMVLYEQFKEELSMEVFRDVNPFSIVKVYVQAGIDSEWEAEWAMFAPESIEDIEKDNFRKLSDFQRKMYTKESRQGAANWYFSLIDEGYFMDAGNVGYLQFTQVQQVDTDETTTFILLKGDDGLWYVEFGQ